jgi:hypothetical protein
MGFQTGLKKLFPATARQATVILSVIRRVAYRLKNRNEGNLSALQPVVLKTPAIFSVYLKTKK